MKLRLISFSLVAAVGVIVLSSSAADACSRAVKMRENDTAQRFMQVRSGKSCSVGFNSLGPMDTVKITKQPSHGKVETNSFMTVKYTAQAGYAGADSFTYARVGRDSRNNSTVRTIAVSVSVIP